jgi:hypothetical protein
MMKIELTQGLFAIVDEIDHAFLSSFNWCVTTAGYAYRVIRLECGRRTSEPMHRTIMGLAHKEKTNVDHINGEKLDNRRSNLRICTVAQNQMNRKKSKSNKSGFKGVTFFRKRWRANIRYGGKQVCLGSYDTPNEAHEVYCLMADMLYGEFARHE